MARQTTLKNNRQANIRRIRSRPISTGLRGRFPGLQTADLGSNTPGTAVKALVTPTEDEKTADLRKRFGGLEDDDASSSGSAPGLGSSSESAPSSQELAPKGDGKGELASHLLPTPMIPDLCLSDDTCLFNGQKLKLPRASKPASKVRLPEHGAAKYDLATTTNTLPNNSLPPLSQSAQEPEFFDNGNTKPKVKLPGTVKQFYASILKLRIPQSTTKEIQGPVVLDPKPVELKAELEFKAQIDRESTLQYRLFRAKPQAGLLQLPYVLLQPILRFLLKEEKNKPIEVDPNFTPRTAFGNRYNPVNDKFIYSCTAIYNLSLPIYYQANVFSVDLNPFAEYHKHLSQWPKGSGIEVARQTVDKLILRSHGVGCWKYAIRVLRAFCIGTGPNGTNRALRSLCLDLRDGSWRRHLSKVYEKDPDAYIDGIATNNGINNHPNGDWRPIGNGDGLKNKRGARWEGRYDFVEMDAPRELRNMLEKVGIRIETPKKGKGMVPGRFTVAHVQTDDLLGETGLVSRMLFPTLRDSCQALGYQVGDGEESYHDGGWAAWNRGTWGEWSWEQQE